MAGSGIRGQFEEKFKALLRDIEEEKGQVICFIDEVHTLFNLGKAEGSIDAGQMIKPALARGLQLVGATTRTLSIFAENFGGHLLTSMYSRRIP
jgi:ATP-dependent Clp protease ATP-binding subunit ClpB